MRKVAVREARECFAKLLDAAEAARSTIIARNGRGVAVLEPISRAPAMQKQASLLRLARSGRGFWGANSGRTIRRLRQEWSRK